MDNHPEEPPFKAHKRYYLFLKIAVIVIVALLTLQVFQHLL